MKRFKKLITVLFAVVMFLSAFCLATPHASEVKAADAGVSGSNITRGKIPNTVPEGKLFAGWYKDSELTIPAKKILDNRTYYPKYVDEGVLSIKLQVKTRDDGKVNMRIISSVDELNYEYVGFDIYFDTDAVNETNKVNFETKKVQQRVDASVTGVTYDYSPKVVDTDSEYFVTGTITGIASTKLDKYFYIKPYWKTLDGTKVYGVNRYCSVSNGTNSSNINIPIKMSLEPITSEDGTLLVKVGTDTKGAKLVAYKEGYAHLNIAVDNKNMMDSATKITVDNDSAIYRNLESTRAQNDEDKSWYEVYDAEGETEFVIATDADLYGFSALSTGGNTFAGKTVYMVADISANEDATVDGKIGSVTGTPYTWNPIGPDKVTFAGTFDGQGHTISNIYYNDTGTSYDHGFFGIATDTTIVKNFSIKDSYFDAGLVAGSVAGKPKGTFESIYSNAYVKTSGQYSGGLFGSMETDAGKVTTIDNCWFDGTVDAGNHKAGGVVGYVSAASSKNNIISNCLVTGTVSSKGQEVGGLCGYIVNGTPMYISNCVTNATLTGTNYVGGIIGWLNENTGANSKTIINDVYTTATTGSGYGAMRWGTIAAGADLVDDNGFVNTMLDFDTYWTTVDGGIPELRTFAKSEKEAPNVNRIYAASLDWTFDVAGTEEDPYLLEDAADLLAFITNPWDLEFDGKVVKLKNDIAFNVNINDTTNRKAWTKIGSSTKAYNGTFDGQGHTISGVFYNNTSATWDHGFFGVTGSNAVIQNFSLVDSYFKGADVVGSIAGKPNGTFKNIYSNAKVEGARWIGGFFGNIEGTATTTIENCWFDGQVIATGIETGGLIGYITTSGTTTVDNCLVTGSVSSSANYLGGFFGSIKSGSPVVLTNSITTTTPDGAGFEACIVGNLNGVTKDTSKVILNNVFTTSPNASGANGAFKTNGAVVVENLEGKNGYIHTVLDFDKYWTIVAEGTPELRTFAETELSEPTGNRQIVGDTHWLYTAAGTEDDPYMLEDAADLLGFAEESSTNSFEGKVVKLKNDITVNVDITNSTVRTAWIAIGNAAGKHPFNGTFDGQGYTISGIYYEYTNNSYDHGFFGITGSSAVIQNFQLKNSYFKGPNVVGSIAGKPNGTFKNIYSAAIVEGTGSNDISRWIGGFFGSIEQGMGSSVENCWFDGVIKNTGNSTGGFIGQITATDKTTVINNCLVTGTMENQNGDGGGFCGAIAATSKVRLSDSLITTVPNGSGAKGSMIGNPCSATKESSQVVLNNVYTTNSGDVCGKTGVFRTEGPVVVEDITGQKGYVHTLLDFDKYWTTVDGDIPELRTFAKVVQNAPIGNRQIVGDTHWLYTAAGTEADPYILEDAADLLGFAQASSTNNFEGKVTKLKNDITLNADIENETNRTAWPMIGNVSNYAFNGTFDGQGHTISGIYYNSTNTSLYCHGFFGYTGSNAKIQNFRLTESYFHGPDVVGSIAGKPSGTFKNIYSSAKVEATINGRWNGGFFGSIEKGASATIENCWFAGSVYATGTTTGGLIGQVDSTGKTVISNCLVTGSVENTSNNVGGFIGSISTASQVLLSDSLTTATTEGVGFVCSAVGNLNGSTSNLVVNHVYTTNAATGVGNGSPQYGSVSTTDLGGENGYLNTALDFDNYWTTVADGTPELRTFAKVVQDAPTTERPVIEDVSWLATAGTKADPYVLKDAADLLGFSAYSAVETAGFSGKVIELKNDITVNAGWDATTATEPTYSWTPIGHKGTSGIKGFEGTFDGKGHTISGLYFKRSRVYAGLFAAVDPTGTVQNVKLTNSYFESSVSELGSFAGLGNGTFYNLYSDATIVGQYAIGGIIGHTNGAKVFVANCWFDGSVKTNNELAGNKGVGGIIGYADNGEATVLLKNCLNTADIDVSSYLYDNETNKNAGTVTTHPCAGGLIGRILSNYVSVEISSSLNTGSITRNEVATGGTGPIIGYSNDRSLATIYATYATEESSGNNINRDGLNIVDAESIKGDNAATNMSLLGWGTDWQCVDGKFPEIIFTVGDYQEAESVDAKEDDTLLLTALYPTEGLNTRTLYQGELHAHAKTYGSNNMLGVTGDDGNTDLSKWKTQMSTLGLDFAASLDHKQTHHIKHPNWLPAQFIYGTEAGADLTGLTYPVNGTAGELHYNMLFATQADLVETLNASGFTYNENTSKYEYKDFSKSDFITHVNNVMLNNGFFIHAHPTQTAYASYNTSVEDYYFRDYVGFEVFYINTPSWEKGEITTAGYDTYGAYGTNESSVHYNVWNALLKQGKRLYATAGSDTHGDLNTYALTSVYSTSEAASDKGTIITQLRAGDFTAGAVGVQMCIDNTAMGGHFAFTDSSTLVVNIDKFHFSNAVDSTHKYRVDVITEDGVVYSRPLTIDEATATPTNGKIALKVDSTSEYYRVEVVDATIGHRIAIGQPIWNDKNQ